METVDMGVRVLAGLAIRFSAVAGVLLAGAWVHAADFVTGDQSVVIRYALESWYLLIPAATGVAIASVGRPRRGDAITILVVSFVVMVALDFVPESGVDVRKPAKVLLPQTGEMTMGAPIGRWNSSGALPVAIDYLRGRVPDADVVVRSYTGRHPRMTVAHAVFRISFLLVPVAVAGFVFGAIRWMERSMLFTSRAAERIAEFVLGWVLGPVLLVIALHFADNALSSVLFDGTTLLSIALPMITLVALSGPLWLTPDPLGDE